MSEQEKADWEKKKLEMAKETKPSGKIKIELDRTPEMKDLEEENKRLKTELDMISVREFDKEVEKFTKEAEDLGLEVGYIDTPQALEHLKTQVTEKQAKKTPSGSVPLTTEQTTGYREEDFEEEPEIPESARKKLTKIKELSRIAYDIPVDMLEFDSIEQMTKTLDEIANDRNHPRAKEAQKYIAKLWKKHVLQSKDNFEKYYKYDHKTGKFKETIEGQENE